MTGSSTQSILSWELGTPCAFAARSAKRLSQSSNLLYVRSMARLRTWTFSAASDSLSCYALSDMFEGAGCLTCGTEQGSHSETVFAIDNARPAAATYKLVFSYLSVVWCSCGSRENYPNTITIRDDISKLVQGLMDLTVSEESQADGGLPGLDVLGVNHGLTSENIQTMRTSIDGIMGGECRNMVLTKSMLISCKVRLVRVRTTSSYPLNGFSLTCV